jgi:ribonuclease T1
MNRSSWRAARMALVVLLVVVGTWIARRQEAPAPPEAPRPDATAPAFATAGEVTVRNLEGAIVFQGMVDLSDSLARIDAGERHARFRNDGAVFQNRERRLPAKPAGYHREWVHPTPGLEGPGPQRIVTGADGEAYYTPDHYGSFERIR